MCQGSPCHSWGAKLERKSHSPSCPATGATCNHLPVRDSSSLAYLAEVGGRKASGERGLKQLHPPPSRLCRSHPQQRPAAFQGCSLAASPHRSSTTESGREGCGAAFPAVPRLVRVRDGDVSDANANNKKKTRVDGFLGSSAAPTVGQARCDWTRPTRRSRCYTGNFLL